MKRPVFVSDEVRNAIIEECARAVEKAWPLNDFPTACENTDIYRAQDAAVRTVLKVIRRLVSTPLTPGGENV